jgi:hypothetical protein
MKSGQTHIDSMLVSEKSPMKNRARSTQAKQKTRSTKQSLKSLDAMELASSWGEWWPLVSRAKSLLLTVYGEVCEDARP